MAQHYLQNCDGITYLYVDTVDTMVLSKVYELNEVVGYWTVLAITAHANLIARGWTITSLGLI